MICLKVKELIEFLEELPQDYPVCIDNAEITEITVRDEIYYAEEGLYSEGFIVKLY